MGNVIEMEFQVLTPREASCNLLLVRRTKDHLSAMGSLALDGGQFAAQLTAREARAGDLNALHFPASNPTPSGATSDNAPLDKRGECPLCDLSGNTRSGSGIPLAATKHSVPPSWELGESQPLQALLLTMFIPWALLSMGLFCEVFCG